MTTAITTNGGAAGTLKLAPRRYSSRLLIITFITYYYAKGRPGNNNIVY